MRYLAFLLAGLISLPASALTNVNLYKTTVAFDQTQDGADARARATGMKEVIIRATGDKQAADNEVVQKALRQYNQYLNQFSYGQNDESSTITMEFSAPQIRSLITQAQLPFWPANRASVLIWLVEESKYERTVAWEHSDSKALKQIKDESIARGLPLTVPVGDFDDITGLEISDLWGGFVKPISLASDRYPTDAILVVKSQGTSLRWTLYDQNAYGMLHSKKAPIQGRAAGSNAAMNMIDQISDYYAEKNSVLVGEESSQMVLASFSPIKDAEDFFSLENRLKKLSSVASLDILKVQGTEVVFGVHLLASEENFEQEVLRIAQVKKAKEEVLPPTTTNDLQADAESNNAEMSQPPADVVVTETIVEPEYNTLRFNWLD